MMAGNTVTIGMPLRNGEKYLRSSLTALVSQTRQPDRIVISDNASDDDSVSIAESIAESNPVIEIIRRATCY